VLKLILRLARLFSSLLFLDSLVSIFRLRLLLRGLFLLGLIRALSHSGLLTMRLSSSWFSLTWGLILPRRNVFGRGVLSYRIHVGSWGSLLVTLIECFSALKTTLSHHMHRLSTWSNTIIVPRILLHSLIQLWAKQFEGLRSNLRLQSSALVSLEDTRGRTSGLLMMGFFRHSHKSHLLRGGYLVTGSCRLGAKSFLRWLTICSQLIRARSILLSEFILKLQS